MLGLTKERRVKKTWGKFKTITKAYFELKDDNKMNKKYKNQVITNSKQPDQHYQTNSK